MIRVGDTILLSSTVSNLVHQSLVSFGARREFQGLSARDGMALQRQSLMMVVMGGAGTEPDPAGLY